MLSDFFSGRDKSPSSSRYDVVLDRNADRIGMYYKTAIFYYFLIFSKLLEILHKVFSNKDLKNIDDELNDYYEKFWGVLQHFKTREDFANIPVIKDTAFESLHCDFKYTSKAWAETKKYFYEDLENIRKQVPQAYPIPFDIEFAFQKVDKLLKNEAEYEINYKDSGEIILNNKYLLSRVHFGSENDVFFGEVFKNPRKEIKKKELQDRFPELHKDFHKLVYELGFKGELLKIFFPKITSSSVYFQNYVTKQDLEKLIIDISKLQEEIGNLKLLE